MKIYNKIGAITSLLIVGYLAVLNINGNKILFGLFALSFIFGFIALILELKKKKTNTKER